MAALLIGTPSPCPGVWKLKGDQLGGYEAADLTKITIVATKRRLLMISTVAQQPVVVKIAARSGAP
jgi:hypothetical protein